MELHHYILLSSYIVLALEIPYDPLFYFTHRFWHPTQKNKIKKTRPSNSAKSAFSQKKLFQKDWNFRFLIRGPVLHSRLPTLLLCLLRPPLTGPLRISRYSFFHLSLVLSAKKYLTRVNSRRSWPSFHSCTLFSIFSWGRAYGVTTRFRLLSLHGFPVLFTWAHYTTSLYLRAPDSFPINPGWDSFRFILSSTIV